MTAGSRAPVNPIACRAPREGHQPAAVRMRAPGPAQAHQAAPRGGRYCLVSRLPGHGGVGAPVATCAHPAAGLRAAVPGPRVITGTAAQLGPRQAGLAVAVVLAGTAGLLSWAGSCPGTAARYRELARPRPGLCPAPVPCATVPPSAAAGSRVAGLAHGAGG